MGSAARRRPQSRSRSKMRRFGFLNLFGFNTDACDVGSEGGSALNSTASSRSSSRSCSRSHSSSEGAASNDGRGRDRSSSTTAQPQGAGKDIVSGDAIADDAVQSSPAATAAVLDANYDPANVELQTSSSRLHLDVSGTRPHPDSNVTVGAGVDGARAGGSEFAQPVHPDGLPITPAREKEYASSGSQIRTCPIPERLQMQLREQEAAEYGSLSTTPWSASTTTESPRIQPEARARRRGTVGSFGHVATDSRHSALPSDKQPSSFRLSTGEFSPRIGKLAMPLARRTSSNNSSWSTATPTSALSTADSIPAPVAPQTSDGGFLPEWEPASQSLSSSKSRSRGRRYSVFDISFAGQRAGNSTSPMHSASTVSHPVVSATSARRRGSSRSVLDFPAYDPSTATSLALRRAGAAAGAESGSILGNMGSSSNIRRHTNVSRQHAASLAAEMHDPHGHPPITPIPTYTTYDDYAIRPARHQHQPLQQSHSSIMTFSAQSQPSDELQRGSGLHTPTSERSACSSALPGFHRRSSHHHYRAIQLPGVRSESSHESSSGRSTPSNRLFTRLGHNRSTSVKSATATDSRLTRKLRAPIPASIRPTTDTMRSPHPRDKDHDLFDGTCAYGSGSDEDAEVMHLKFTASTPDILFMPITYQFGGQTRAIKRPDYSYERLLAISRSTKARQWRRRHGHIQDTSREGAAGSATKESENRNGLRDSDAEIQAVSGLRNKDALSTVGGHCGRKGVSQKPESDALLEPPLRRSVHYHTCGASDSSNEVAWEDWTDSISSQSHAAVVQRAIEMWHKILRSWRRSHRPKSRPIECCFDSSMGHIGETQQLMASTMDPAAGTHNTVGISDMSTFTPLSSASAGLNPHILEPLYLQRGVSESGRRSSLNDSSMLFHQLAGYSQLSALLSPLDRPDLGSKDLAQPSKSSNTMPGHDDYNDTNAPAPYLPLPSSSAHRSALQIAIGDSSSKAPVAIHRRLSIVKDQELGRSRSNIGNRPNNVDSQPAAKATGTSSSTGGSLTLNVSDKQPQRKPSAESSEVPLEMLLLFRSRLESRLRRAKTETEDELLSIIQDLSTFVEEGLSYVHEDMDVGLSVNEGGAASGGFIFDDYSHASDDEGAETPGLVIPEKALLDEHRRATQAGMHIYGRTGKSGDDSANGRTHLPIPPPPLPAKWASEAATARTELRSLDRRLHDVLDLHGSRGDSRADSLPHSALANASRSSSPTDVANTGRTGGTSRSSSPRRPTRSPSIRRLAFLKSLSSDDHISAVAVSTDSEHIRNREKSPAQLSPLPAQPQMSFPGYLAAPGFLPTVTSSTPARNIDVELSATCNCQDTTMAYAQTAAAQRSTAPCIVCTPTEDIAAADSARPHTWHSAQSDVGDYFEWNSAASSQQSMGCSLPKGIPFPSLQKQRSSQSIASRTSSRAESRNSPTRHSGSRTSLYSTGSAVSLLSSPLIAEDEFRPTPFLMAIMDLVNIIGNVLSLSAEEMLCPLSGPLRNEALTWADRVGEEREHVAALMPTAYLVQRLNGLGYQWEQSQVACDQDHDGVDQSWPCRSLFVQALLAVSSLNRIVMWYQAVCSSYSDEDIAELDMLTNSHRGLASDCSAVGSQSTDSSAPRNTSGSGGAPERTDPYEGAASVSLPSEQGSSPLSSHVGLLADASGSGKDDVSATQNWSEQQNSHPHRWQEGLGDSGDDKAEIDRGLNMLVEVALDGRIRYISPTCRRLLGADPDVMIDQPAAVMFDARDIELCRAAVEQLLADSTRTVELNIRVHPPALFPVIRVEAKGMLIYGRLHNEPSHVLWVLRYISTDSKPQSHQEDRGQSIDKLEDMMHSEQPQLSRQQDICGTLPAHVSSEAQTSAIIKSANASDADEDELLPSSSPLEPITCRICDRSVPATHFEEHSWLCATSHRAAMDVEQQNERLGDIRTQLQAWFPGCAFEDLEDMIHGGIDMDVLRDQEKQKADAIGNPAWQMLVDEAAPIITSMIRICIRAMALDGTDAAPQCILRPEASNQANSDFARSGSWTKVAEYKLPPLGFNDPCLDELGQSLMQALSDKQIAVENLQYAIIDSSLACINWDGAEKLAEEPMMFSDLVPRAAAKSTSDLADTLGGDRSLLSRHITGAANSDTPLGMTTDTSTARKASGESCYNQQSPIRRSLSSYSLTPTSQRGIGGAQEASAGGADDAGGKKRTTPLPPSIQIPSRKKSMLSSSASSAFHDSSDLLASSEQSDQFRVTGSDSHPTSARTPGRTGVSNASILATPTVPSIHDFDLLKPISKGAYGSVYLAKKRSTGDYYAIKILKKADMIAKNQISNVKAERAIMMAQSGSPFVVRLLYTFQSRTSLYLVMEYLNGGDCASLLKVIGALPEEWVRHYLAEVVLGIEDLHARGVVHRDLKPDNLLIDTEGHLKLTDFGLSKLGFLGRRVGQQVIPHSLGTHEPLQLSDAQSVETTAVDRYPWPALAGSAASPTQLRLPVSTRGVPPPSPTTPPSRGDVSSRYTVEEPQQLLANKRIAALKEDYPPQSPLALEQSNVASCSSASISSSASGGGGRGAAASNSMQRKHALGTPDYIAPESILGLESGESVDWWALGVICYEFLFGVPPFHDSTPEKVFENILSGTIDFYDESRELLEQEKAERQRAKHASARAEQASEIDDEDQDVDDEDLGVPDISPETRDFITRLLCRDPRRRLGYHGSEEVKAHPIFKGINWDTLLDTQPAFIPQVESVDDTDYFDPRGATMESNHTSADESDLAEATAGLNEEDGALSKSHHEESITPKLGAGIAIRRPKTLPVELNNAMDRVDRRSATKAARDNSLDNSGNSDGEDLPRLDKEREFGGFTFKNLHALEEANMTELLKLRRRSTLIGAPSHFGSGGKQRESLPAGLASDASPLPRARRNRSCLGNSTTGSPSMHTEVTSVRRGSFVSRDTRQRSWSNMTGPPQLLGMESGSMGGRGSHQQISGYGVEAGFPLARTATLPMISPGLRPSTNVKSTTATPVSSTLPVIDQHQMSSQIGHTRAASTNSQRGSLLNPKTQLVRGGGYGDQLDAYTPTDDALFFDSGSEQPGGKSSSDWLTPPLHPPAFRRSATIAKLHRTEESSDTLAVSADYRKDLQHLQEHMQSRICLVADDNPVSCKIMEIILQRMHMRCVVVRNGAEAIRCIMGRTVYRAIFMDTGMPIVDGDEATRMVKSTYNANKDTPIFAMAAYEGEANKTLYDGILVKPVTSRQIKQLLNYQL
ncbi:rim15, signal transduction response regulator [Coemansia guatemalensis]|uniref:non-specific serine/threonine protein kinase n=1 Tax=Coemansia guatemalensis TaxID=2761395 RepID=A0A9W8I1Q6_9FUNG|nr:rim15, signal transduction response regulator [Coemansia guatemalensis]